MDDATDGPAHEPLSQIFARLMDGPAERIAVGDMVDAFGPRAFGALLFAFAIPNLLPLPPGSSTFLSIPILIIAPQLVLGLGALWLPSALDRRSIRRSDIAPAFARLLPRLEQLERLLRPRLRLLFGPLGDRLIGLVCLALALVLVLPIPLGNLLPATAIALLALGLTQRDGVVVLLGYVMTAVSAGVLVISAHAVVAALAHLKALFGL